MQKETSDLCDYIFDSEESILYIQMKDGAEMNLDNTKVHYELIKKITDNKPYVAMVDATFYFAIDRQTLEYTALKETIDKRVATAHYNCNDGNLLTAHFFNNYHKPGIPFKVFKLKEEAMEWIKSQMKDFLDKEEKIMRSMEEE